MRRPLLLFLLQLFFLTCVNSFIVGQTSHDLVNLEVKAKEKFPSINLLTSKTNLGYSGGCNFGAKNAKGEYIIFLNNDTLHTNNWIEELISFLDNNGGFNINTVTVAGGTTTIGLTTTGNATLSTTAAAIDASLA